VDVVLTSIVALNGRMHRRTGDLGGRTEEKYDHGVEPSNEPDHN
jgi:hypothetical protein